jgi:hypothetical protein
MRSVAIMIKAHELAEKHNDVGKRRASEATGLPARDAAAARNRRRAAGRRGQPIGKPKVVLTAILAAATIAGCASATSQAAVTQATTLAATGHAETAHITVWSVNSDGPDFRAILTGAVGDYGPGVTVYPDGAVDPAHSSDLKLNLSHGSFLLSIAKLDSEFGHAVVRWPYDRATCSIHGTVTGTAPIVAGSGTGAYRGIAGAFTLTLSLDEVWVRGPACSESSPFQAQLILMAGTGSVRR